VLGRTRKIVHVYLRPRASQLSKASAECLEEPLIVDFVNPFGIIVSRNLCFHIPCPRGKLLIGRPWHKKPCDDLGNN
jgi:hypothetical protein